MRWPQTPVCADWDFRVRHGNPRPLRLWTRLGCAPLRNFGSMSQDAQWDAWEGGTLRVVMPRPSYRPGHSCSAQESILKGRLR